MTDFATFFSLLSDETRLRCLVLLSQNKELCVCALYQILELSQPKVSRHLSLLRSAKLIQDERRGQWVYYRLSPQSKEKQEILTSVLDKLLTQAPFSEDHQRLLAWQQDSGCVERSSFSTQR